MTRSSWSARLPQHGDFLFRGEDTRTVLGLSLTTTVTHFWEVVRAGI
jgi:hypothetical protein